MGISLNEKSESIAKQATGSLYDNIDVSAYRKEVLESINKSINEHWNIGWTDSRLTYNTVQGICTFFVSCNIQ